MQSPYGREVFFGPYDRAIFHVCYRLEKKGVLPIIGKGDNIIDIITLIMLSKA